MSVCVIPARGGSQRIPNKNRKLFHGRPIITYSIETAIAAGFDVVSVSTDDDEIAKIAADCGATVHWRSPELCEDSVGTQEVVKSVLMDCDIPYYATVCCLYPCAPLLNIHDLIAAYEIQHDQSYGWVYSVSRITNKFIDAGQFYIGHAEYWYEDRPLGSPGDLLMVTETVDINTPEDWELAEKMYGERHGNG